MRSLNDIRCNDNHRALAPRHHPFVPIRGIISASGDIRPLSYSAATVFLVFNDAEWVDLLASLDRGGFDV